MGVRVNYSEIAYVEKKINLTKNTEMKLILVFIIALAIGFYLGQDYGYEKGYTTSDQECKVGLLKVAQESDKALKQVGDECLKNLERIKSQINSM